MIPRRSAPPRIRLTRADRFLFTWFMVADAVGNVGDETSPRNEAAKGKAGGRTIPLIQATLKGTPLLPTG